MMKKIYIKVYADYIMIWFNYAPGHWVIGFCTKIPHAEVEQLFSDLNPESFSNFEIICLVDGFTEEEIGSYCWVLEVTSLAFGFKAFVWSSKLMVIQWCDAKSSLLFLSLVLHSGKLGCLLSVIPVSLALTSFPMSD